MATTDNLTPDERVFHDALEKAGMLVDEQKLREQFTQLAQEDGVIISNPSSYSPFWRYTCDAIVAPSRWLARFLAQTLMPGLYVKTARGKFLDLLAYGYALERKPAAFMRGNLTFTRENPEDTKSAIIIPQGAFVRSTEIGGKTYRVFTDAEAELLPGETSIVVAATAEYAGSAYNLTQGGYCIPGDTVPRGLTVTNTEEYLIQPGADEESDTELRLRCRNQFAAVGDWHTDAKYKAIISSFPGFRIDYLFFVHDAPRGPGTANCFALFDAGVEPASYLEKVNDYIMKQGNHGHGDDLIVYALPSSYYVLRLSVALAPEYVKEDRERTLAGIEELIRCAFRLNSVYDEETVTRTMPYDAFSISRLDYELHSQFSGIISLVWEHRKATESEKESGVYDEHAQGWTKGDNIISELDVPRLLKLVIIEVEA